MTLRDIPCAFKTLLETRGISLGEASLPDLLHALADTPRPDGLADYAGDEDMLMAEWHRPFQGTGLEILLVRQFMTPDGAIHQLQICQTFRAPPAALHIPGSSDWQMTGLEFLDASRVLVAAVSGMAAEETRVIFDQM